jgi:hypothetical protein
MNANLLGGGQMAAADPVPPATPPATGTTNAPPMIDTSGNVMPNINDVLGPQPAGVYNPWSRMEGGVNNAYGPSPQYMAQATLESMALANAYFAPQRMELAYQLGDMETDMRRLAVNLGRQVDDPVLQAKMYKEAMQATRALDVQQNTFAFQMSEQRRREEMQNFQYYDQLAQEEARLKLQNRQFYEQLMLQKRYYNLQNWNVQNPPTGGTPPATGGVNINPNPTSAQAQQPVLQQNQYPNPTGPNYAPAPTISSLAQSILRNNPYSSSMGGGNVTQSTWGL